MFKKLLRDKRAFSGLALGLVLLLVIVGAIIPVGMLVSSQLKTSIIASMTPYSKEYNTTTDLYNNIWSAYSLATVIPILAGAGAVIGIIVAAFAVRRLSGEG